MYRLHTAFSGTWAPDYAPVRGLFLGRKGPLVISPEAERLTREIRLSRQIHLGAAARLVSDGRSLLQRSAVDQGKNQSHRWGDIFDCHFLTIRTPVSHQEIVIQLLRRQWAVALDLAANGLYPDAVGENEIPGGGLAMPDIVACGSDIVGILGRVSGMAAGFSAEFMERELSA